MHLPIWVIAQKDQWCPKEGAGSGRITDSTPEVVPSSRYYGRLIADGSLRQLTEAEATAMLAPVETAQEKKAGKK